MRISRIFVAAWLGALALIAGGQMRPLAGKAQQRVEITLERFGSSGWKAVDPRLVFKQGDKVRFRFRTNFDGYLYVLNRGTSGSFALLFPGADAGRDNRVETNQDYVVPREAGSFAITGKAGYEILYWILSPVALDQKGSQAPAPDKPPVAPPADPPVAAPPAISGAPQAPKTAPQPVAPSQLRPRCNDSIFRARGECVDTSAGPQQVQTVTPTPWEVSALRSRDLVFTREQRQTVVSSPSPLLEPVIYEYRLAHR